MAIDLQNASYVPTIYLRGAELLAVAELPEAEKDILTPIFCLKPWATSNLLERSMDKIQDVYPDRPYFLDIDPFYNKDPTRPAQEEFYQLVEDVENNQRWVDFFNTYPNAYPCIQIKHGNLEAIRHQINEFTDQEKTFLVRLENDGSYDFGAAIAEVCKIEHSNFGFVLDAGWSRDLLSRANWVDGLVKQIVTLKGDAIPIITTGSSFPVSFTRYELGESVSLAERTLFNQIVTHNNQAKIIYGDWASSRSPSEGGGGGQIPPRLELPTESTWEIFRADEEHPNFNNLASELTNSENYPDQLDIWATYMIEATKLNDANGINSQRKAAAVRVNMHLYRQLHFDNFDPFPDTDDEYIE